MKLDFQYLNSKYEKLVIFYMEKCHGGDHKCGCHLLNIGHIAPQKILYLRHRGTIL